MKSDKEHNFDLVISSKMNANISFNGSVRLLRAARFEGTINAKEIVIEGLFNGVAISTKKIWVKDSAIVCGDLFSPVIVVDTYATVFDSPSSALEFDKILTTDIICAISRLN